MNSTRYNQIIDEVYENYVNWVESPENQNNKNEIVKIPVSKEDFIKTIKGNDEIVKKMGKRYCDKFSQEWGIHIEERELSSEERKTLYREHCMKNFWALKLHGTTLHYEYCMKDFWDLKITGMNEVDYEKANIPTKVIALIYQNETIEIYE